MRLHLLLATCLGTWACGPEAAPTLDVERSGASAHGEVRLASAVASYLPGGYGNFAYATRLSGAIEVENLDYEKRVFVMFQARNNQFVLDGWRRLDAEWASGETWTFETPEYTGDCPHYCWLIEYRFAVGYEVGGRTYWDNNDGWDYGLSPRGGLLPMASLPNAVGDLDVRLAGARIEPGATSARGEVIVRNRGYEKRVTVHSTTDGWQTVERTPATFSHAPGGAFESWTFVAPIALDDSTLELAIEYEVGGERFWDNNLGRNHVVARP